MLETGAVPYRILLLQDFLFAGGATRALVNFARKFDRKQFVPSIAGIGGNRELLDELVHEDFSVHIFHDVAALRKYLAEQSFQAIVFNRSGRRTTHTDAILECFTALDDQVAVLERNIFGEPDPGPLASRINLRLHQSVAMLERYLHFLGVSAAEEDLSCHAILENPVDETRTGAAQLSDEERLSLRREWGVPEGAVLVGHVCRPDTERWDDVHLHMLSHLCRRHPRVYYLAREAPASRVKRVRRASRGRCVLLPFTTDESEVYATISCLDIFTHASRIGEACSNAIMEAMAIGLPVVTRSNPHRKHCNSQVLQVDHARTGFVADTADTYAAAVEELVLDADKRQAMGAAGRAKVENNFSPHVVTRRLERLLLEVLQRRGRSLSGDEERFLSSAEPAFLSFERYAELSKELCNRAREVYGPPTRIERLVEKLRTLRQLFWRFLDKMEKRLDPRVPEQLAREK
jgi:glycosyltransferase involved in cell wall biosynthesis